MTKVEFETVLNDFNISKDALNNDIYRWEDFIFYFGDKGNAIIVGKIPFEVAQIIYDKYPGNPYFIKIHGNHIDTKPIDCVNHKKFTTHSYKNFKDTNIEIENLFSKKQIAKKVLNNSEKFYINYCHIETKFGLKLFIYELQKYYLRKDMKKLITKMLELEVDLLFKNDIEEFKDFDNYFSSYEKKVLNDIKKSKNKKELNEIINFRLEEIKKNIKLKELNKNIKIGEETKNIKRRNI